MFFAYLNGIVSPLKKLLALDLESLHAIKNDISTKIMAKNKVFLKKQPLKII